VHLHPARGYNDAMTPQIYLIGPAAGGPDALKPALAAALAQPDTVALLLPRGERSERDYKDLVKALAPEAQAAGAAVLIEGEPGLVRMLGADGLHVAGDVAALREALSALRPDFIVGAGGVQSRDDAMAAGELGPDYILFGPLSGTISTAGRELARWWAETMEIPGVLSDPDAKGEGIDAEGCEFIGLGLRAVEPVR